MDFKLGFAVVTVFLFAAVVSTVVLACLYCLQNANYPPPSNSALKRAKAVFGMHNKDVRWKHTSTLYVGRSVAVVSNLHPNRHLTAVERAKADGKQVIAIDTKPFDLANISQADVVISSKLGTGASGQLRLYVPPYAVFMQKVGISPTALVQTQPFSAPARAEFLAACVCSTLDDSFEGVRAQKQFVNFFQQRTNTTVLTLNKDHENLARFRFVLAFEAASIPGFVTKQLVKALLAGSIPVYWGAPDVANHFNPKRFLNIADFESFDACIDEMLRLDANHAAFAEVVSEPCLLKNALDANHFPLQLGGNFYSELYKAVPNSLPVWPKMVTANNIHFVTFADGQCFQHTRIIQEAHQSGYFDTCTGYGPSDLPGAFLEKFNPFVAKNKRGFGYWMWKPVVIQTALRAAAENDIVVWCDSGSSVRKGYERKMLAYYQTLQGKFDVIGFEINVRAICWTKADLYETLGVAMDKVALQLVGNTILIRKTAASVKLIDEWAHVTQSDPHNLDDSPSRTKNHPSFREHRHDQSCWDLLTRGRKYPGLFISRDNLYDRGDIKAPLAPTRKKC